jgi:hypothetical protein
MRLEKPAIILYFVACIAAVFAMAINSEILLLISKPIILPAILFYYLSVKEAKFNWLYAFFLLLTFIGDTIVLLQIENETLYIMLPYVLSYIILLYFILKDVQKLKFSLQGLAIGLFVFSLLMATAFTLVQFFSASSRFLTIPVLVYAFILSLQAGLAAYHFQGSTTNMSFYMAMTALFNCVSDTFYVIYTLIIPSSKFHSVDLALQVFSYYFVIKYFVLRKN